MDYTDLNDACLKDNFPLPRIDQIVDALQEKMQFLTYIILTYDYICQHCVFKLAIMTYTTYFKAIMTYIQLVVLFHDLG